MSESIVYNMDCMEGMKQYDDNYFDLAIVDPPYGIGMGQYERAGDTKRKKYHKANWDDAIPDDAYFHELKRVSKNYIIWGGNYFKLLPCKEFIFWYKHQPVENFSDGELAYTSFNGCAKCFDYPYYGNINQEKNRMHPTQKPVALYKWLLKNYAKEGDKILDTHLGSGSSRIACYDMGYDFVGYEIDKTYYDLQEQRYKEHTSQINMFIDMGV